MKYNFTNVIKKQEFKKIKLLEKLSKKNLFVKKS